MSFANCVRNSEYEDSWEKNFDTEYMPNAFPSLLEMSLMPATKPQPLSVAPARSGKCKKVVMEVPIKSYADEKREEYQSRDDREYKSRMDAYEILSNKEKLDIRLTKTRMCKSVDSNTPCSHGDTCRFAHHLTELVPNNCLFKDNCRFVRMKDGKLVNNGNKMCHHRHPEETYDEFIMRTGLDRYKIDPKIEPKTVVESLEPKVVEVNKKEFSWFEKSTLVPPVKPTRPVEKEILLRVPKELAIQAMELAMKSGKMCIRVEIVG